jgi:hypothetical protein
LISGSAASEHTSDLQQVARDFARQQLAPHGALWDKEEIFPVDVLKQAAELGFAGLFVDEKYGGCELSRSDGKAMRNSCISRQVTGALYQAGTADTGVVIFEALSYGDVPTTAYLTIHNMVAGVLNRWGRHGQHQQRQQPPPQQQQTTAGLKYLCPCSFFITHFRVTGVTHGHPVVVVQVWQRGAQGALPAILSIHVQPRLLLPHGARQRQRCRLPTHLCQACGGRLGDFW